MNLVRQDFSYVYIRLYTFFFVWSSMIYIRLYTYITKRAVQENYLLQNFSLANPFCTELKCMELNWSFISQNSIINQFTFKRWKFTRKQTHLSHVVFLKTCPLWKCMKIAMTKEGNKMILFFFCSVSNQQRINEKSVVFFSYEKKKSII